MDILKPDSLPYLFLAIAAIFLINYLRHLRDDAQHLAQRNRLRLALIFALVGGVQLLMNAR